MLLNMSAAMVDGTYHRIAEGGEDTPRVHTFASGLLLAAMVTLPLGICGDVYVVFYKVTNSMPVSVFIAIAVLAFFYGTWFGYTSYRRAALAENK